MIGLHAGDGYEVVLAGDCGEKASDEEHPGRSAPGHGEGRLARKAAR
ncbi:hypothetical protein [Streptomyces sp. NPDC047079]